MSKERERRLFQRKASQSADMRNQAQARAYLGTPLKPMVSLQVVLDVLVVRLMLIVV